jgi:class 3 adenylate cyclase/DNA-binding winged helix-turn-helix (wHTH) protein/tetratricopeptide (TPR) repeat protein
MRYRFGDYTLDTQRYALYRAGQHVPLRPKVFQVLVYLLTHRDRVVSKDELLAQGWPGQFPSDETLNSCITAARQAVGDSGQQQAVIQTRRGYGYGFVAMVEEDAAVPPAVAPPAAPPLGAVPRDAVPPPAIPALPEVPSLPCVACQHPHLPASQVCGACGLPLEERGHPGALAPRPVVPEPQTTPLSSGERKQVTVLAGTLVPTPAPATLGPEVWETLRRQFFGLAQQAVQRYEGTLQPLGEAGVLALFGAPVAQEDHAWRAVRVALALLQQWEAALGRALRPGEAVIARVGVHSGWVVAGSLSDAPQPSLVVGGDTAQGAMCLQGLAAPGTLLVSALTLQLLRAPVHSVAAGLIRMPGHAAPLMAYTVRGLEALPASRRWSPLVGRQRELAVFEDLLARTLAGQGQVVGLIGEPGIGKSRLLATCLQRLPARPVTVLESHCHAYDQRLPYGPLSDLLRQQCGLSATAAPPVVATRVDQLLQAVDLSPATSAPYLLPLLGSPTPAEPLASLPPEDLRERTFATLRHVHLRSSQQQPVLLVVDNLHWIDPTSEAYLASLVEHLSGVPLLLLTTYRPGYRPCWMDKSYATQLTLPRLTLEESATLVRALLPPARAAEALVQRVLARAQGNPLFLEELAHAVQEQEGLAADTPVPATIQAVLAARIDRLPPEAKHLLHTAAVLGPEVPVPLLAALAALPDAALHRILAHLQAAELLYETCLVPERVYTFKHVLTHEVAYSGLLRERRRELHARLVELLETRPGDRGAEQVERLAHHAVRGEVWEKAVRYCRQAGTHAAGRSGFREASVAFEQALGALQQLPARPDLSAQAIDLRLALRNALVPLGAHERLLAVLLPAEVLAADLGDPHRQCQVAGALAASRWQLGDLDGSLAAAQRAQALATELGDVRLQVVAQNALGQSYWALSHHQQAAAVFRRNVALVQGARGREHFGLAVIPAVSSRAFLAWCLAELGAFAQGREYGAAALRLAEAVEHPFSLALAGALVGHLFLHQGALAEAIGVLERSLTLGDALHLPLIIQLCTAQLGVAYTLAGRLPEALSLLERALAQSVTLRLALASALYAVWLGEGYVMAGRVGEARALAQQALEVARTRQQQGHQAYALRLLGEIAATGEPLQGVQAATHYRQALALAEAQGLRPLQAHCYRSLGTLYATRGQQVQARTALHTASALYQTMAMTCWLPQTEIALAQVEDGR